MGGDLDIEKFFDRVNHDMLMARMARRIKDKRLLKVIRSFLEAGMMIRGVVESHEEGTPQGSPLSPLMSNVLLDELDKELERRGHRFCRYSDDCNVYVRSKKSGERVKESLGKFLLKRLRLNLNPEKSVVGRPWKIKFLGYSMTMEHKPRLKVSPESVRRARIKLRGLFRKARGCSITKVIPEINGFTRGWVGYYKLAQTKNIFEEMDEWLRRRLRWVLWRQWKRARTRAKKMIQMGLEKERAWKSAMNGRGAWWNSGASHMNAAITSIWLERKGLLNLVHQHQRLNFYMNRRMPNGTYGGVRGGG